MANADVSKDAVVNRQAIREEWVRRLSTLVESVESWAQDLGWSTRRIEATMKDSEIGTYRAPALLLQQETTKVLLEPIARSAPGAEGVADLYRMPAYDDVASLYYQKDRWQVHSPSPGTSDVGTTETARSKPLSKETLQEVLEALKIDAA